MAFAVTLQAIVGYARHVYTEPGPLTAPADVVVPRGSQAEVAETLARAGVIFSARNFRIAAYLTHGAPLHAAEFAFPAYASLAEVLAILRSGRPVEHHVTLPEGLTASQIALILARDPILTGPDELPPEGAVLPQTYDYQRGTTRAALLARGEAAMRDELARLWAARAPDLPLDDPEQAVILASIVERETADPAERKLVAAVFLNRLRRGMKLQADPTAAYAADGGMGPLGRPLSRADLAADNPYNTYRVTGLPPGPICSPGAASLRAVLQPAATDALYFVADGSGHHVFATTLDAQNHNVAALRHIEAMREEDK